MPTVRRMRRIQVLLEARMHADELGRRILQAEFGMSFEESGNTDTWKKLNAAQQKKLLHSLHGHQHMPRGKKSRGMTGAEEAAGTLKNAFHLPLQPRDLRIIDPSFANADDPNVLVRRHCMIVNLMPVRAMLMSNRILLFPKADLGGEVKQVLGRLVPGGDNASDMPFELQVLEAFLVTVISDLRKLCAKESARVQQISTLLSEHDTSRKTLQSMRDALREVGVLKQRCIARHRILAHILDNHKALRAMSSLAVRSLVADGQTAKTPSPGRRRRGSSGGGPAVLSPGAAVVLGGSKRDLLGRQGSQGGFFPPQRRQSDSAMRQASPLRGVSRGGPSGDAVRHSASERPLSVVREMEVKEGGAGGVKFSPPAKPPVVRLRHAETAGQLGQSSSDTDDAESPAVHDGAATAPPDVPSDDDDEAQVITPAEQSEDVGQRRPSVTSSGAGDNDNPLRGGSPAADGGGASPRRGRKPPRLLAHIKSKSNRALVQGGAASDKGGLHDAAGVASDESVAGSDEEAGTSTRGLQLQLGDELEGGEGGSMESPGRSGSRSLSDAVVDNALITTAADANAVAAAAAAAAGDSDAEGGLADSEGGDDGLSDGSPDMVSLGAGVSTEEANTPSAFLGAKGMTGTMRSSDGLKWRLAMPREDSEQSDGGLMLAPAGMSAHDLEEHYSNVLELLIEAYVAEIDAVTRDLGGLTQELESAEKQFSLLLSTTRNRLLVTDIGISMTGLVLGLWSSVFGAWGMNLESGYETEPGAFWEVLVGTLGAGVGLLLLLAWVMKAYVLVATE